MEEPKTATFIKRCEEMRADARLFRMDPPYLGQEIVTVSRIDLETYIYVTDMDCDRTKRYEMPGSVKGSVPHEEVLRGIGYRMIGGEDLEYREPEPLDVIMGLFVGLTDALMDSVDYTPGEFYLMEEEEANAD